MRTLIERLWSAFTPAGDGTSDRELLGRFNSGDAAAFDVLVRRHGPMVLGVRKRVLGNPEDAEDAFQATFILLARKARAIQWRESARNWLYEVAYRTSCKARTRLIRRREVDRAMADRPPPSEVKPEMRELVAVIDEELARMPASARMPLVLCCLQNHTVDEAARQLGCTPAALKSRLQRGREQLRDRLARRGFTLSIALLMATLVQGQAAVLASSLIDATVRVASSGNAAASVLALANHLQMVMFIKRAVLAGSGLLFLTLCVVGGKWALGNRKYEAPPAAIGSLPDDRSPSEPSDVSPLAAIEVDRTPVLGVSFDDRQRFGFVLLNERDPGNPDKFKKLTYMEDGSYNNTCVKIDGSELLYGQRPGHWVKDDRGRELNGIMEVEGRKWVSAWDFPGKVRVVQTVMIVPNEDTRPARLSTALVHYLIENRDQMPHQVGLRMMIDTYIGAEDGVPFLIPGQSDLVTTKLDLRGDIPDFIQALERPRLEDPGTTATMMLKFPPEFRLHPDHPALDPVDRLLICRYPGNPDARWDFTRQSFWDMNDKTRGMKDDSCVTLYWPYVAMPPRSKRAMAFTYGLGKLSGTGAKRPSQVALTYNPKPAPGSAFTVTAWIKNPGVGQTVTINLPSGMSLVHPKSESQSVVQGKTDLSPVSWKVMVAPNARPELCLVSATTNGIRTWIEVPVRKNPSSQLLFGS